MRSFVKAIIYLCLLVLACNVVAALFWPHSWVLADYLLPPSYLVSIMTAVCGGCAAAVCALRRDWKNGILALWSAALGVLGTAALYGLQLLRYLMPI